MLGSILYKEYLKIRWPLLTLIMLNGLLNAVVFIDTRHLFMMDHAEMVWYRVMHLGQIHYDHLKYAPAVSGLLIAFFQYLPEMLGERLRLSLHLPVSPHRLIFSHIVVGLKAVGSVILLNLAALALGTAHYFPPEAVSVSLLTAVPWGLAGMAAYLGLTLVMLEPSFRLKLFNAAVAAGIVGIYLHPADPGGYRPLLLYLLLPMLLMIPAVLLPAYHFRYRRVAE
jgi:hypothetical protein